MEMTIEDIKHCLKVMVDCEVCEECNLYGTTGTDHCEHDCVCGALDIINKYQKIEQIYQKWNEVNDFSYNQAMRKIGEVVEDGTKKCRKFEADYEARLKADMVAMLSEIQLEIEEVSEVNDYDFRIYKEGIDDCMKIIQAKINVLKGIEDGNAE